VESREEKGHESEKRPNRDVGVESGRRYKKEKQSSENDRSTLYACREELAQWKISLCTITVP
jgi:hypothetical protein